MVKDRDAWMGNRKSLVVLVTDEEGRPEMVVQDLKWQVAVVAVAAVVVVQE